MRCCKKITEGNARNSRLTTLKSQKSEKHAWFGVLKEKYAREPSRPHVHNAQSYQKHVVSSKSTKDIVLKPFISIILVTSRQSKKER